MYCKRVLKTELNIWRYRFKSIGIAGLIPLIICLVIIPLSFTSMLKDVGIYQEDAYTRLFWIWEIINVIICVYWPMLLLETYINHKSKEFFRHLTGGWKIKDSIQMFLIYVLILSLTFLYIAFFCKSFIPVEILWKDYLSLVCETIFVQGLFAFFCFRIKNTLFPMLGVFLLVIQQKQSILLGYEWLYFMNGSIRNYGAEVYYIKYMLGIVGIIAIIFAGRQR